MKQLHVHFPVVLPGPRTGQTLCTAELKRCFERAGMRCIHHPILSRKAGNLPVLRDLVKGFTEIAAAVTVLLSPRVDGVYFAPNATTGLAWDVVFMAIARWRGRYVLHHHSAGYVNHSSFLAKVLFALTPRTATHVFSCDRLADAFQSHYGERRVLILPLSFMAVEDASPSLPPPPSEEGVSPRVLRIGHLSNLCDAKGLSAVIEASRRLMERGVSHKLVLAGPPNSRDDAARIQAAIDANPHIEHIGPVYGPDKQAFYRSLDLFLFPTSYANETWGLVVSEATSLGVPCVVTRTQCLPVQVPDQYSIDQTQENWEEEFFRVVERLASMYRDDPEGYAALRLEFQQRFLDLLATSRAQLTQLTKVISCE